MSRYDSYAHVVAIGVDRLLGAILFGEPDVTISSLCWLVRTGRRDRTTLLSWQVRILWYIGGGLEFLFPGHIALARSNDIAASSRMRVMLGALYKGELDDQ